jgi:predicted DNA-binding transcriptional regulator AlpA
VEERFLTLSEAAAFLRLRRSLLYERYEQELAPGIQVDGRILFPLSELEKAIAPRIAKPEKGRRNG